MALAREGLYATLYLADGVAAVGTSNVVALLTGIELNWSQNNRRFYSLGSIIPEAVFDGAVAWNGSFKRAYTANKYLGSLNVGTCRFLGSICPRGTAKPAIMGTVILSGGALSNLEADVVDASTERQDFILYNVSFSN